MPQQTVLPDDALLRYDAYSVQKDRSRASFTRHFASGFPLDEFALQAPGASVRWETAAEEVVVSLRYGGGVDPGHCSTSCAITNQRKCYTPKCKNACAARLRRCCAAPRNSRRS